MSVIKNRKDWSVRDAYYTPKVLVEVIIRYVPKDWHVWCPFDTENSEFVHGFLNNGNTVTYSHISIGDYFFEFEQLLFDIHD